ncbi:MAG: thiamine biosynthesis protein ThiS [Gammaproteobacteria bacterium RIFCSPLOWO2_02_FULL_61_13]|nr:MAG: thiamine biosynthesis protein ThiS [Gammaproteobacteria bacterium RIFCSPLOWO2_02_FULL_61_13]
MQLVINGKPSSLEHVHTLAELVAQLRLDGRIAVEINAEIVPHSRFASHLLHEGDVIEVVQAVGGG